MHSDGTIKDSAGNVIQDTTEYNVKKYIQAEPIPAKYLHADGAIDENSGSGGGGLPDTIFFYGVTKNDSDYSGYCSMASSEQITGVGTYDVYFNEEAIFHPIAGANAIEKISITIDEVIEGSSGYSLGRFVYEGGIYYLCLGLL